jgi:tRNA(fMet)-specific endonuclease VapC
MREYETEDKLRFLNALAGYPLEVGIADRAGTLIRVFRREGLTLDLPDAVPCAIIAATAIEHDLVLLTHNRRHFPMQDLNRLMDMSSLA